MALIMSIEMDHEGIIEAIKAVANAGVATPVGKKMVIDLVAVRKPTPGYKAVITFEDLEPENALAEKTKSSKSQKAKVAEKKTLTEQAEESQKKMGTSDQVKSDGDKLDQSIKEEIENTGVDDVELSPMDAAAAPGLDDELDEESVDSTDLEVKPFDIDGTDDEDDVFD